MLNWVSCHGLAMPRFDASRVGADIFCVGYILQTTLVFLRPAPVFTTESSTEA